jgi:hypothetical protein
VQRAAFDLIVVHFAPSFQQHSTRSRRAGGWLTTKLTPTSKVRGQSCLRDLGVPENLGQKTGPIVSPTWTGTTVVRPSAWRR